jgi:hypothetical protein
MCSGCTSRWRHTGAAWVDGSPWFPRSDAQVLAALVAWLQEQIDPLADDALRKVKELRG